MEFLRPFLTTRDCRDRTSSSAHLSQPLFHPYQMDPHLLLQPLPTLQPPPAHQASNTAAPAPAHGDGSRSAASSCDDDEVPGGGVGGVDGMDEEVLSESGGSSGGGGGGGGAGGGEGSASGCVHTMDATDLFFMSMARSVKALHPRVQAYVKLQLSALVLTAEMTQQQSQLQQLQQQVPPRSTPPPADGPSPDTR